MAGAFILFDIENNIGIRVGNINGVDKLKVLNPKLKDVMQISAWQPSYSKMGDTPAMNSQEYTKWFKENCIKQIKNQKLYDTIFNRIIYELNWWNIEYDPEQLNIDSNMYEIGLDRSNILTIVCEFENYSDEGKIEIPIENMEKFETIGDLYWYMEKLLDGIKWSSKRLL